MDIIDDRNDKETLSKDDMFEILLTNMEYIQQYAAGVVSYSSRYNTIDSVSYSPDNLPGIWRVFPRYEDSPETFMLRTYGKWWKESESAQLDYRPQDADEIGSEDYIVLKFDTPVVPTKVNIYETYNPGAIVRLYGRLNNSAWHLLFESQPQDPSLIPKNVARCFSPTLHRVKGLINELRIELNQSLLQNCTGLDAVVLCGYRPLSQMQLCILTDILGKLGSNIISSEEEKIEEGAKNYFEILPYEVLVKIFKYLDLKSLLRCTLVNKRFSEATMDPTIYRAVALKKYWMKVDNKTLKFFQRRCTMLRKLDLTWCGDNCDITEDFFQDFLRKCGTHLTHLSVGNCDFIRNVSLGAIAKCLHLVDLRMRYCLPSSWTFTFLSQLSKLQAIDLCGTNISTDSLIRLLQANRQLKHLIIDYCEGLTQVDDIFETISKYNPDLVTLSGWKISGVTARGVQFLARCRHLRELDLGWTLTFTETSNCLDRIAYGCPDLRRLIISNWRKLGDAELVPIACMNKQLTQLDISGIRNLSPEMVDFVLASLPNLEFLDISFCSNITMNKVFRWRDMYPGVTISPNLDDFFDL